MNAVDDNLPWGRPWSARRATIVAAASAVAVWAVVVLLIAMVLALCA